MDVPQLHPSPLPVSDAMVRDRHRRMHRTLSAIELCSQHGPLGHRAPPAPSEEGVVPATSRQDSRSPGCIYPHHGLCFRHVHWWQLRLPTPLGSRILAGLNGHRTGRGSETPAGVKRPSLVSASPALACPAHAPLCISAQPPRLCPLAARRKGSRHVLVP